MTTDALDRPLPVSADRSTRFYIDGSWVEPYVQRRHEVINPATGKPAGYVNLGSAADVDRAVIAARTAFPAYAAMPVAQRIALFGRIIAEYEARAGDLAAAVIAEMGSPKGLAEWAHVPSGATHLRLMIEILGRYEFERPVGNYILRREPIGVCGLITPWNWPINQVMAKVAYALAAGCTVVLKPSEIAPLSAILLAEIFEAANVPPGVFNLVNGDGPGVGEAIAAHPDIDMVSFTGSTRAGILVAKAAADSVKKVAQELGGKSANIILDDADFNWAVREGVTGMMINSGQSCSAPSRMLVPADRQAEVAALAAQVVAENVVGDPLDERTGIGPVASQAQYDKIQGLIATAIEEGCTLVAGGLGKPDGLEQGHFVRPTIFADVRNDMVIAQEEVFGPVLVIIPYRDEEDAIAIANDSEYGLAAYVQSVDPRRAYAVAARLRAGNVYVNGALPDFRAPFGGYKRSGNGREWGEQGFEEYLETKALLGLS